VSETEIAAKVRGEVAEEIAQAIEARIRTRAGMSDQAKDGNEHLRQAARIARNHAKESGS
jgi:hypothetical protein